MNIITIPFLPTGTDWTPSDSQQTTGPPLVAIIVPCILVPVLLLVVAVAAGLGETQLACMLCTQMQLALLHVILNATCEHGIHGKACHRITVWIQSIDAHTYMHACTHACPTHACTHARIHAHTHTQAVAHSCTLKIKWACPVCFYRCFAIPLQTEKKECKGDG